MPRGYLLASGALRGQYTFASSFVTFARLYDSVFLLVLRSIVRIDRSPVLAFSMRPEKVFGWREQLPPPFDQLRPTITRRDSIAYVKGTPNSWAECKVRRRRSESAHGAVDQADRSVTWLKYIHASHAEIQQEKSDLAVQKLRRSAVYRIAGAEQDQRS